MKIDFQWAPTDVVYRYTKLHGADRPTADGHLNFKHAFRGREESDTQLQLEKGIYAPKQLEALDHCRRPVVLLRSSPGKAGTAITPWHDDFDSDPGRITYFGDNRPG